MSKGFFFHFFILMEAEATAPPAAVESDGGVRFDFCAQLVYNLWITSVRVMRWRDD